MDMMLRTHAVYAPAYIDDIIIYSFEWSDHIQHCDAILVSIAEAGMTVKLSKCHFALPKVKYIGHWVSSEERSVVPDKEARILAIPELKNKKLLRSYLGKCS